MFEEQVTVIEFSSLEMISVDSIADRSALLNGEQTRPFIHSLASDHTCTVHDENVKHRRTPLVHLTNRSSILRHVRKGYRTVQSACYPSTNEPSLFQMKYFDGRPTLIDLNAVEILQKSSSSFAQRRIFRCLNNFLRFSSFSFIHNKTVAS